MTGITKMEGTRPTGATGSPGPAGADGAVGPPGPPGSTTLDGLTDVTVTSPTTDHILRWDTGSSQWVNVAGGSIYAADSTVVKLTGAQTVAGKKTLTSQLALPQIATPSAAAAGTGEIYFKSNALPYYMNPAGIEVPFNVGDVVSALHANADFENQTAGVPDTWSFFWQTNGATTSTTNEALSGIRSALVTLSAAGNQQVQSDVLTVAAGDLIEFSIFAKKGTGAPTLALNLQTRASGTPDFFDAPTTLQSGTAATLTGSYTRYSQTFAVPSGHTVARLAFTIAAPAAATAYLDNSASRKTVATVADLDWLKRRVVAATTANVTVAGSAPNTLDGVTLALGDRVLVCAQTTQSQNGLYTVTTLGSGANGTWTRTGDTAGDLAGAAVSVRAGTVNGGTRWATSWKATDTLGTTAMVWSLVFDNDTGWAAVSFASNWANFGNPISGVVYRKIGNEVILRGTCTATANQSAGATIFTLPAGFRPATNCDEIFTTFFTNGAQRIDVTSAGLVKAVGAVTSGWYQSLSGVRFFTS